MSSGNTYGPPPKRLRIINQEGVSTSGLDETREAPIFQRPSTAFPLPSLQTLDSQIFIDLTLDEYDGHSQDSPILPSSSAESQSNFTASQEQQRPLDYCLTGSNNSTSIQLPENQEGAGEVSNEFTKEPDVYDEEDVGEAFHGKLLQREFRSRKPLHLLDRYLRQVLPRVGMALSDILKEHHAIRSWVNLGVKYTKPNFQPNRDNTNKFYLNTNSVTLLHESQIQEVLDSIQSALQLRNANFIRTQSGLVLEHIDEMRLNIAKYDPLVARSYLELPTLLEKKKAIVNVQNKDNRCFAYAVLSMLHYKDHRNHTVKRANT